MYEKYLEIIKYLVSKGGDNLKDTIIDEFRDDNLERVKTLVSIGIVKDDAIVTASMNGQIKVVKYLVSIGADPRCQDNEALISACMNGHLDTVKYLVSAGADVTVHNNNSIIIASSGGHLEIVKYLVSTCNSIAIGTFVQSQNNRALIEASEYGHLDVVKFLTEQGADVQARDNQALLSASQTGYIDVVNFLLSKGANIEARNNTAINWAIVRDHFEMFRYLYYKLNKPSLNDLLLENANINRRYNIAFFLVKKGANWKKCNIFWQEIFRVDRLCNIFHRKNIRFFSRNLLPIYYSPQYIGGKLAKKDLENFISGIN